MLEIRKSTATKNYENVFFREFAENLKNTFDIYDLSGLLIGNPVCKKDPSLKIDVLLVTPHAVCIIDFKNYGGTIILPNNNRDTFENGKWSTTEEVIIGGGSEINPFAQLKKQKKRFIEVVSQYIQTDLPETDIFNPTHTIRAVCFQKPITLKGTIPTADEQNFFIMDCNNCLETIMDMLKTDDPDIRLSPESINLFKEVFEAGSFHIKETYQPSIHPDDYIVDIDNSKLQPDQQSALKNINAFLLSPHERFFILQGTSLSGKSHLIPSIRELAYRNNITDVKLFAGSGRIANNLYHSSGLPFKSLYSWMYGENEEEAEEIVSKDEIIPLKKSTDPDDTLYIIDEAHLISNNKLSLNGVQFGSGKLLDDFIEFAALKDSKRKILFIGDAYQLNFGDSCLNTSYLSVNYDFPVRYYELIDKEEKSPILRQALKAVEAIRQDQFNHLSFDISPTLTAIPRDRLAASIAENPYATPILCYQNRSANEVNKWIKTSILQNGEDLCPGDLILFCNNVYTATGNDPLPETIKIPNGQFAKVTHVSEASGTVKYTIGLKTSLVFRDICVQLPGTHQAVHITCFENFRQSTNGKLTDEEIISYRILLRQLAGEEIENFRNGTHFADIELKELLDNYTAGKTGKTRLVTKIMSVLNQKPGTEYYKVKNAAHIRFGWALTVHKAMSQKWDEIYFDVKKEDKTNKEYFKLIYTGMTRATRKVNLINYEPISPFSKIELKSSASSDAPVAQPNIYYAADPEAEIAPGRKYIQDLYNLPNEKCTTLLLQLYQFIEEKISTTNLRIEGIKSHQYLVIFHIRDNENQSTHLSFYYNNRGEFKNPGTEKASSDEFADQVVSCLKAGKKKITFDFNKNRWRNNPYKQINQQLEIKEIHIDHLRETLYKDTLFLCKQEDKLIVDMHYNADGFFTTVRAIAYTGKHLWEEFSDTVEGLKNQQP